MASEAGGGQHGGELHKQLLYVGAGGQDLQVHQAGQNVAIQDAKRAGRLHGSLLGNLDCAAELEVPGLVLDCGETDPVCLQRCLPRP